MTNKAQTILEYVLLIGIATIALVYMGTDFRRGIQSVVKVTADQIGTQANADQDFSQEAGQGVLAKSSGRFIQNQNRTVSQANGVTTYAQDETTQTVTNTITNINDAIQDQ